MTSNIGLVDYGISGNLFNVRKALELAGAKVTIIQEKKDFKNVHKIVLPGVGSFKNAMDSIEPFRDVLIEVLQEKPTLGICLGMQILSTKGFEGGETKGLGLIDAEVKKMEIRGKVPHLGWGKMKILNECPLLEKISPDDNFYFMHSYEMINYQNVIALTEYCEHNFVSAIQNGNLFGVQFHPEKSRDAGLQILRNFLTFKVRP